MDLTSLLKAGLSEGEVTLFHLLLTKGPQSVQTILTSTSLKRGDTYNKLYALRDRGFIEEYTENKKLHFRATNPLRIEELITEQFEAAAQARRSIEAILPAISRQYSTVYHQPSTLLYTGKRGMRAVLDASLEATEVIRQMGDYDAFIALYPDVNTEYVKRRKKLGLKKHIILEDTPSAHALVAQQDPNLTIRIAPKKEMEAGSFSNTTFYCYNETVSYLTHQENTVVGVLITDPMIARLQKSQFDLLWNMLKK